LAKLSPISFHGASPEAEPLGLHRQILTQLRVAISEVVSDYSDSAGLHPLSETR
jgi:hypothetical protein